MTDCSCGKDADRHVLVAGVRMDGTGRSAAFCALALEQIPMEVRVNPVPGIVEVIGIYALVKI